MKLLSLCTFSHCVHSTLHESNAFCTWLRLRSQAGHVDSSGRCALVHAAQRGHLEALCLLLKHAEWSCATCCGQRGASRSQAVQQALTAAANMGHTEVRTHALTLTHTVTSLNLHNVIVTVPCVRLP